MGRCPVDHFARHSRREKVLRKALRTRTVGYEPAAPMGRPKEMIDITAHNLRHDLQQG